MTDEELDDILSIVKREAKDPENINRLRIKARIVRDNTNCHNVAAFYKSQRVKLKKYTNHVLIGYNVDDMYEVRLILKESFYSFINKRVPFHDRIKLSRLYEAH